MTVPTFESDEQRVARNLHSAARARIVFALLGVGLPGALLVLFDRKARRLEAVDELHEALQSRAAGWKAALFVFLFFALNAAYTEWRAERLRTHGPAELRDPETPRRNMKAAGVFLLAPMVLTISGLHALDAMEKGESVVPVVLAAVLLLALMAGLVRHVTGGGAAGAAQRAGRLLRWLAPVAIGVAVLRVVALFLER